VFLAQRAAKIQCSRVVASKVLNGSEAIERLKRFEPSVIRRDQTEQIVDRKLVTVSLEMSKVKI
jgi:hypothetical protein